MKIYADPITANCRKVLAGLKLMNVPYELVHVDYFTAQQKTDWYKAVNPNESVPSMVDGDFTLWESNAILAYAADKHGKAAYYPTDLKTRADIHRWMQWEGSAWFPSAYIYLVENCVKPLLNAEPDPKVLADQAANFHKLADILDSRLAKSEWLCGANVTLADIVCAAPMHLHSFQKLPLAAHPNLQRWMTQKVEKLSCWDDTFVGEGFSLTRPAMAA
jgi:glutathione S-transferase